MKSVIALILLIGLCAFTPIECDPGPPCPVELASFTGRVQTSNTVLLEWQTLSEINNYGFYIIKDTLLLEASFTPGHGTTNMPQYYRWIDTVYVPKVYTYQLKQIDLDGTVHYSNEIRVSVQSVLEPVFQQ